MNLDDLVKRVTQEINKMKDQPEFQHQKKFNAVVIPIASDLDNSVLNSFLKGLSKTFTPVPVISDEVIGRFDINAIKSVIGEHPVYSSKDIISMNQILDLTKTVIIPELTLEMASKINLLMADDSLVKLVIEALLKKIPVIANFPVLEKTKVSQVSFTLRTKINELKNGLVNMGIVFSSFEEICKQFEIHVEQGETIKGQPVPDESELPCGQADCTGCGLCLEKNMEGVKNIIEHGAARIGSKPGITVDIPKEVAQYIDHTLLKPQVTQEEVKELCEEAVKYSFAAVCVNPAYVEYCANMLKDTPVRVATVIGFPLGATTPQVKAFETREAVAKGADEIDMVINIGALKSKDYKLVEEDIKEVVKAAQGRVVKVIIETALLNDEEKVAACLLSKAAGADFVKTSTGFGPGGATLEDVFLMRSVVGLEMGVKASGGVRDFETAQKMIEAGASRIGASAGVKIVKAEKSTEPQTGSSQPTQY